MSAMAQGNNGHGQVLLHQALVAGEVSEESVCHLSNPAHMHANTCTSVYTWQDS